MQGVQDGICWIISLGHVKKILVCQGAWTFLHKYDRRKGKRWKEEEEEEESKGRKEYSREVKKEKEREKLGES